MLRAMVAAAAFEGSGHPSKHGGSVAFKPLVGPLGCRIVPPSLLRIRADDEPYWLAPREPFGYFPHPARSAAPMSRKASPPACHKLLGGACVGNYNLVFEHRVWKTIHEYTVSLARGLPLRRVSHV
jgi:hypothetical protein